MNPVKLQTKSGLWYFAIIITVLLLLLNIITAAATPDLDDSCIGLKIVLIIMPLWLLLYYLVWSRILIKMMDTLTCECAEHGKGYAIFHYSIWTTIGHPYICFGAFVGISMSEVFDIFSDSTCTSNTSSSLTINVWTYGFLISSLIYLIIVICAGVMVSYKNHKDVKIQLHWKEQNKTQRENALSSAMSTEIYAGSNNETQPPPPPPPTNTDNDTVNDALPPVDENNENQIEMEFGDVNMDEFEAKHNKNQQSTDNFPPPQSTEEQLRMAIAASINTAHQEQEKRTANGGPPGLPDKDVGGNRSVSMSGFWAKGQAISSALLGNMFSQQTYECVVCYEDYEIGQVIAKLRCGHKMHKKCAKEWLAQNPTCPFCRVNILRN